MEKTRGFQLRSGNTPNSPNKSLMAIAAGALTGGLSAVYGKAGGAPPSKGPRFDNDEERGFSLKSGNTPPFKMMGSSPSRQLADPNSQQELMSSTSGEEAQAVIDKDRYNKQANVTKTDGDAIKENIVEPPKVNKAKTIASKIGNTLVGAFTSGLDAVYGQGKAIPGDKVKFHDPKKKDKDSKTTEEIVDDKIKS